MEGALEQPEGRASERLVAELHRTVTSVSGALDRAAAQMLDAAEAEGKRRAEAAAVEVDKLIDEGIEPVRKLSADLLQRAIDLDREVERLTAAAAEAAASLRRTAAAPAPPRFEPIEPRPRFSEPIEPRPRFSEPIEPRTGPPDPDRSHSFLESPLDRIEATRDSIAEHPIEPVPRWRRFRQPKTEPEPVPEGVRNVVEKLRVRGEPDAEIAGRLQAMGVEHPAEVVSRIPH